MKRCLGGPEAPRRGMICGRGCMATALMQELADHPELLYRHTVQEYEQMLAKGLLEEAAPFELLDGKVVRKLRNAAGEDAMTVGDNHTASVLRLGKLDAKLEPLQCHVRTQQPIRLPPHDEPEPDGVIAIGTIEDYLNRKPGAADVLCVIEVADASLARDRGHKLELYANAGIEMYVIINLVDRVVEVHTHPIKGQGRYAKRTPLSLGESVAFPTAVGGPLAIPVRQLLP